MIQKLRQRLGRALRLNVHDIAKLYVVLPYYMEKTKEGYVSTATVALKWAKKMFEGWDISKSIIDDRRIIK